MGSADHHLHLCIGRRPERLCQKHGSDAVGELPQGSGRLPSETFSQALHRSSPPCSAASGTEGQEGKGHFQTDPGMSGLIMFVFYSLVYLTVTMVLNEHLLLMWQKMLSFLCGLWTEVKTLWKEQIIVAHHCEYKEKSKY